MKTQKYSFIMLSFTLVNSLLCTLLPFTLVAANKTLPLLPLPSEAITLQLRYPSAQWVTPGDTLLMSGILYIYLSCP